MFQNVNLSLLSFSKADAKVEDFNIPTKYIFHFFLIFLKLFPNSLISKDVVEHKKSRKQADERKGHIIIYAHVRAGTYASAHVYTYAHIYIHRTLNTHAFI